MCDKPARPPHRHRYISRRSRTAAITSGRTDASRHRGYERSSGGYIALDNTAKRIVVAFHGTRNAKDWMEK